MIVSSFFPQAELKIKTPARLNVPPRFRDSAFFDKGENGVIKIPFTGNPKPRISWQREGESIETGGHFQVKTEERHAILTIMDVSKVDSGRIWKIFLNPFNFGSTQFGSPSFLGT